MANERSIQQFREIFGEAGIDVLTRIEKTSPRLVEHIYDYIAGNIYQDDTLDIRTRELCVIACIASQGGLAEQLAVHIRTALRHGVRREEIVSTIEAVGVYAGVPRALNALFTAIQVFADS